MANTLEPVAYWPMTENAGNFADISGNSFTATPSAAPTYQNITLPDGSRIPLFDGSKEATFWTTGFRDVFNGNQGSLIALCKIADTEWEDGTARTLISIRGNNDLLTISKAASDYAISATRAASGDTQTAYFYPAGKNDVMVLVVTWNNAANQFYLYSDGRRSFALTAAEWAEQTATTYTRIGRSSSAATDYWLGNIGHVGITDKVLSAAEVKALFEEFYPTTQNLFVIGDSKAVGAVGAWRGIVLQGIETASGIRTILNPTGYAIGGYDVGEMLATVNANLSSETATPIKICINLGANDAVEPTPQASFEADYIAIIDALRAKWPGVPIYIAKVWRADQAANCATLNGYIDNIIAHYVSGVTLGPNEAVWLENGDNGATYTGDGIHYNDAAQPVCAAQWLTAMGY